MKRLAALLLLCACAPGAGEFPVLVGGAPPDAPVVRAYPVPDKPLEWAGDQVRSSTAAGVVAVQAHAKPRGRFPDLAELRFLSYDAVLGGARGLWYDGTPEAAELRFAVSWTARELRAMAPIFARGKPAPLPFPAPAEGWAARAWRWRGRTYLVLANRTRDRHWKVPAEALEPRWRPLFETRRDPRELLHAARGAHYLKPYQVLVLESRLW